MCFIFACILAFRSRCAKHGNSKQHSIVSNLMEWMPAKIKYHRRNTSLAATVTKRNVLGRGQISENLLFGDLRVIDIQIGTITNQPLAHIDGWCLPSVASVLSHNPVSRLSPNPGTLQPVT